MKNLTMLIERVTRPCAYSGVGFRALYMQEGFEFQVIAPDMESLRVIWMKLFHMADMKEHMVQPVMMIDGKPMTAEIYQEDGTMFRYSPDKETAKKKHALKAQTFTESDAEVRAMGYEPKWSE